jgi:LmbE family N-acetylglucosaminyl deacetylase
MRSIQSLSPPVLDFATGELRGAVRRGLDAVAGLRGARTVRPLSPGSPPIGGRAAVLSPHLDDAALSLGATISAASAAGAEVRVITVLAGDPGAADPAGPWDSASGFATAGEAARARREEDRRACELMGASPVWLHFRDHQYPAVAGEDEVWTAIGEAVGGAETVLVPGAPLHHEDHLWLTRGLLERGLAEGSRLGLYLEQPYAIWAGDVAGPPAGVEALLGGPLRWSAASVGLSHRWRKARASQAYRSQLPGLLPNLVYELAKYEARRGGEGVAWVAA